MKLRQNILIILSTMLLFACGNDIVDEVPAVFDPTVYTLEYGNFPTPQLASDVVFTTEKVALGRMLFYEPKLSKGEIQSCASCHQQKDGFSDLNRFSKGVDGHVGNRQAMPIVNLAWHNNGFFWDGRSPNLREQALRPIQDPIEMNETLPNVITKLKADKRYVDQFTKAFADAAINENNIGLALEQFMLTMVSKDAKYDKFEAGTVQLSAAEERGRQIFFTEFDPLGNKKGGECFHCHGGHNFTNDEYMNNGLDAESEMTDLGRMTVTFAEDDKAKFKTPTLRNIEFTAPYMHDGRFKTLEEVVDHYNEHTKNSPTLEFLMQYNIQPGGLGLSVGDKADLVAFLKTLSDPTFLENKSFSAP